MSDQAKSLMPLVRSLATLLKTRSQKLATAESCTGGLLAATLTELPGSSTWFDRGWITYANGAKTQELGVPATLIDAAGAVSEAVAEAMADGARKHADADVAMSITGIAGPDGGSTEKPVGTVCFSWSTPTHRQTTTQRFEGDRHQIRTQAVQFALMTLCSMLQHEAK